MPKLLFCNVPAHGHVNPTLPVVRELVERGAEVVYHCGEEFERTVRRTGADFRVVPASLGPPPRMDTALINDPVLMARAVAELFPRMMADLLRPTADQVDRIRGERADVVVHDSFCLWGRAVAQILGLPAVNFLTTSPMHADSPMARQLTGALTAPPPHPGRGRGQAGARSAPRWASAGLRARPIRSARPLHPCRTAQHRHGAPGVPGGRRGVGRALRVGRTLHRPASRRG